MNNLVEVFHSDVGRLSVSGILLIWQIFCSTSSFNDKMNLRNYLQKKINLWSTLWCMMPLLGSMFRIGVICTLAFLPGENPMNKKGATPDPSTLSQTQSQSETLKVGDEIVVVDAEGGLQKAGKSRSKCEDCRIGQEWSYRGDSGKSVL